MTPEQIESLVTAGRLIAGEGPIENWLPRASSRFSAEILAGRIPREAERPGTKQLRSRYRKVKRLAQAVLKELRNPKQLTGDEAARGILSELFGDYPEAPKIGDLLQFPLADYLLEREEVQLPYANEIYHGLGDYLRAEGLPLQKRGFLEGLEFLIARCDAKLAARPSESGGQGKNKPVAEIANEEPDATELCALMIGILWEKARGAWPGQHNTDAQAACAALWAAAGGRKRHHGSTQEGWRDPLNRAKARREGWLASRLMKIAIGD